MTTENERALNWLGCQIFRPMDKKYLDTIHHALQQNEKLVSVLKAMAAHAMDRADRESAKEAR